ncbi:hypothetical protein [Chiayiivirga flava]|uniref:Uncharacterized protein n=1 Tax=Chiayiivirga flava TaxID=659595 RepID=A0A7W8D4Q6_9GAMM|nr:hypothetical protein [Chiayiivirga flava]MBB5207898.1 hypothetical protein [Chiayiivirga flava]
MSGRRKSWDVAQGRAEEAQTPAEDNKVTPISFQWFATNLALLSIASLAIGYLWLLNYARAEGIPLRVHGDGVGALVPWLAGTAASLLATPAVLLSMTAATIRLPVLTEDASLHDYLRTIRWKGSSDDGAMRMRISFWAFGVPMLVSTCVLFVHILADGPGQAWVWFVVCAVVTPCAVFPFLHRKASLVISWWNAGWSYGGASLLFTGFGIGAPAALLTIFGVSSDVVMLSVLGIGGLFCWLTVTLIAFGRREILYDGVRGLTLGLLSIVFIASAIPNSAAALAASSLRAMGLGGTTVDLRLRADATAHASDGRYLLVLDTGSQLYLRPCDADADRKGVQVIAWASVDRIEPRLRLPSESDSCK